MNRGRRSPRHGRLGPVKRGREGMIDIYIGNPADRVCCTCLHWRGSRITAEDGNVYSMKKLEAICTAIARREQQDAESGRVLTLPDDSCTAWEIWPEIGKGE